MIILHNYCFDSTLNILVLDNYIKVLITDGAQVRSLFPLFPLLTLIVCLSFLQSETLFLFFSFLKEKE